MAKSLIVLKALPELAPRGTSTGQFLDIVEETGVTKKTNKPYRNLVVSVQLDAKRRDGSPFILSKSYNFRKNGRGISSFAQDFKSWSGDELSPELLAGFDPDVMKSKPVLVEVDYNKQGADYVAVIKGFHSPTADVAQVVVPA